MNTNMSRLKIAQADWIVCGLAVTFAGLALFDGNAAMMVGCVGIPLALVWMTRSLLDRKRRSWHLRALVYCSAIALLIAGPASCMFHTTQTEAALMPVIEALDLHLAKTGHYPKKLSELSPAPNTTCHRSSSRQALYFTTDGGKHFRLTCVTFGMNKHTYGSETKRWQDWD